MAPGHPLCLDFLTAVEASPPELVELAAATGCTGVSFMVHPVAGVPDFGMAADTPMRTLTRDRARDTGVAIDMVEGFLLTPDTDLEAFAPSLDSAAWLGACSVNVLLRDPDPARLADRFAAFGTAAAERGLPVLTEWSVRTPFATPAAAAAFIAGVGQGALQIDVLHLHRGGLTAADLAGLDLIARAQLCDGPATLPADRHLAEALGERLPPGAGALPLAGFLAALPPGIPLGLEVPMADRTLPAADRVRLVVEAARRILQKD
jgi:sugar phosphate isomerase/epimerase